MQIFNDTAFSFASIAGRVNFPGHSLTLIVKGNFHLIPGQNVKTSEERILPTGDEFYQDDQEMQGSPRYESDFAFFKPKADVLLVGSCYAPDQKPIPFCTVTFRVGAKSSTLNVFGDRPWTRELERSSTGAARSFTRMELRYENSFGGPGYLPNPIGRGYSRVDGESAPSQLPNLEGPTGLASAAGPRAEPAGFGPLGRMWARRFGELGTYDEKWIDRRWPWFPEDFQWEHFNAAPSQMQVDGYLKGDEELYLENLHPEHVHYRSRLPSLRVRCFLAEYARPTEQRGLCREVAMNLDTLWVDMHAERMVLVWRGVAEVASEEQDEIQRIFVVTEDLAETPKTLEYYQTRLHQKLAALDQEESVPAFENVESAPAADENDDAGEVDVDEELEKGDAMHRAALLAAGFDPDEEFPQSSEKAKADEARILEELGFVLDDEEAEATQVPLSREIVQERAARNESFAGEDLRGLDLSQLRLIGVDFQGAILTGVTLEQTDLTNANFRTATLEATNLSNANLKNANLKDADFTSANLAGADLGGAVLEGAIFEQASLERAILDNVTANEANFTRADLTRVTARRGDFSAADFSGAVLNEADLQGSRFREAFFDGVVAIQVDMSDTDVTEVRASKRADFSRAIFRRVVGPESIWQGANLLDADFSFARMERADFTSAVLNSATFYGADMKQARFVKAMLIEARLVNMNLFQGSLEKANLKRANLSGANLYAVNFLNSIIDDARLERSNLKMTYLARK